MLECGILTVRQNAEAVETLLCKEYVFQGYLWWDLGSRTEFRCVYKRLISPHKAKWMLHWHSLPVILVCLIPVKLQIVIILKEWHGIKNNFIGCFQITAWIQNVVWHQLLLCDTIVYLFFWSYILYEFILLMKSMSSSLRLCLLSSVVHADLTLIVF